MCSSKELWQLTKWWVLCCMSSAGSVLSHASAAVAGHFSRPAKEACQLAKLLLPGLTCAMQCPVLTWASLNMAGKPIGTKRSRLARCLSGARCQQHLSLCDGASKRAILLTSP